MLSPIPTTTSIIQFPISKKKKIRSLKIGHQGISIVQVSPHVNREKDLRRPIFKAGHRWKYVLLSRRFRPQSWIVADSLKSFKVFVILFKKFVRVGLTFAVVLGIYIETLRIARKPDVWLDRWSDLSVVQCLPVQSLKEWMLFHSR